VSGAGNIKPGSKRRRRARAELYETVGAGPLKLGGKRVYYLSVQTTEMLSRLLSSGAVNVRVGTELSQVAQVPRATGDDRSK
jgi:hypothetical protein